MVYSPSSSAAPEKGQQNHLQFVEKGGNEILALLEGGFQPIAGISPGPGAWGAL